MADYADNDDNDADNAIAKEPIIEIQIGIGDENSAGRHGIILNTNLNRIDRNTAITAVTTSMKNESKVTCTSNGVFQKIYESTSIRSNIWTK